MEFDVTVVVDANVGDCPYGTQDEDMVSKNFWDHVGIAVGPLASSFGYKIRMFKRLLYIERHTSFWSRFVVGSPKFLVFC